MHPTPSPYSWKFISQWLLATGAGGLLGFILSRQTGFDWVVGLAGGVVIGSTLMILITYWRQPQLAAPNLPEINARLLQAVLVLIALSGSVYLLVGVICRVPFNRFFPLDALGVVLLSGVAEVLRRRGAVVWAASLLMAIIFIPVAFNAQYYGMSSPANALYLLGILISGLVLGSNGFFGALAAIATLTALFAIGEQTGRWQTVYAVGTPAQSVGLVLFWWSLYAAGTWLSWLFARTLENALNAAKSQTATLTRTVNALAADSSAEAFLRHALAAIAEQLGTPAASVFLHEAETDLIALRLTSLNGQVLEPKAVRSAPPPSRAAESAVWQTLARTREPLVIDDVANDARLPNRALLLTQNIRSVLYLPLVLNESVVGFFTVNRTERRGFARDEIDLAQALMQQVTLAMQMARLAEQTQHAAIVAERNRMAREMHDTLAQGFTGIVVQLEAAEDVLNANPAEAARHLARARTLARESLGEARRSVYALRPQLLEHRPLAAALRDSTLALTEGTPLAVTFHLPEQFPALSPEAEADLLRVAQEAVTNVLKHASARMLNLSVQATATTLTLEIADDGRGFEAENVKPSAGGGLGLIGLRERAARHNGTLEIMSAVGRGTTVRCIIPVVRSA
ncbi:MAG: GAF domain-containing sensor histidine kinase [Anaerolineales bacterium]|nr:GAF domain-containing sensor histidine kinase [Anaerolineales bacterium]